MSYKFVYYQDKNKWRVNKLTDVDYYLDDAFHVEKMKCIKIDDTHFYIKINTAFNNGISIYCHIKSELEKFRKGVKRYSDMGQELFEFLRYGFDVSFLMKNSN